MGVCVVLLRVFVAARIQDRDNWMPWLYSRHWRSSFILTKRWMFKIECSKFEFLLVRRTAWPKILWYGQKIRIIDTTTLMEACDVLLRIINTATLMEACVVLLRVSYRKLHKQGISGHHRTRYQFQGIKIIICCTNGRTSVTNMRHIPRGTPFLFKATLIEAFVLLSTVRNYRYQFHFQRLSSSRSWKRVL